MWGKSRLEKIREKQRLEIIWDAEKNGYTIEHGIKLRNLGFRKTAIALEQEKTSPVPSPSRQ